jgi:hypothetical protein
VKTLVAVGVVVAALCGAGRAAAAPLQYGVADDWPKFHPCGDVWWKAAKDIGFQELRLTVQWTGTPAIPYQANIQDAVTCAQLNNVVPILAVYPAKPNLIGSNPRAQAAFARFVAAVGVAFPGVQNFIVGNEPNVNRFWQPQYVNGKDAAGVDYEHTLAQSYDALKAVRPNSLVWGPAISSRGNDNPYAASNPSHSPVWFIADMGEAYRASGRTKPIFDEFDMHPYPPVQDTDSYAVPFHWPQAGAANLDRIKQALWDAFLGTGQPTPTEQPNGAIAHAARRSGFATPQALPINLDEVGSQTTVTGHQGAYTDQPESIKPISESQQAAYYTQLMEIAACDPDVRSLLFFPLIDENDLNQGFQSGELYADFAHKLSYAAIKAKIASAGGDCQGGVAGVSEAWQHTTQVIGAQAFFAGPGASVSAAPRGRPAGSASFGFAVTATEDAAYSAAIFKVATGSASVPTMPIQAALGSGRTRLSGAVVEAAGTVKAYTEPRVQFPSVALAAGTYAYGIRLTAAVDPSRATVFVSRAFTVGTPLVAGVKGKRGGKGGRGLYSGHAGGNGGNAGSGKGDRMPQHHGKGHTRG